MRVIAVMEAHTVTGPAKNLIRFCKLAGQRHPGCEISVATYLRDAGGEGNAKTNPFIDAVRSSGIEIDIIIEKSAFDWRVVSKLRTLFDARKPDVVQTHAVKSHFLVRMARPKASKWLAYHHGYTDPDLKMRMYNSLDRWSLPAADRVVTVCQPFARMLRGKGVAQERIRVLGNSIEPFELPSGAQRSEIRARWKIPAATLLLLAIGRLSAEKRHSDLIAAVHLLRRENHSLPIHLLLVGDGPERQRLEQQTLTLGLADSVSFAGHQSNPLPYYAAADLFVLPSLSEGSPNVLLEAMMAETPIISTAVGGVPEMVKDELSASLVEPGDTQALARAIARLARDTALREQLSSNARQSVLANHTPDAYCSSLLGIYQNLVKE